jgi:hypothetical protein
MQRRLDKNRRFGATYRSYLQGLSAKKEVAFDDGPIHSPKTSVLNQPTLRNIQKDGSIHLLTFVGK